MTLQGLPALELPPSKTVALRIPYSIFHLPLRLRPSRNTGSRREPPIGRKRLKRLVQNNFSRRTVMLYYHRPGIVDENLNRRPAKISQRSLYPRHPCVQIFAAEGLDIHPSRKTQLCHKKMYSLPLSSDLDALLAKINLHLETGRRLKSYRRLFLPPQFLPIPLDCPLHRPERHLKPPLG